MKRFGYWVFGKDMYNVNLETLKKNSVTDIFLNYYAFELYGKTKVIAWIKKAKTNNIKTHIWVQCFYDGDWVNPVNMDLTKKRKEIKGYANTEGVYGIHLDYLRYPGNAYKTSNGTATITKFVQNVKKDNPKVLLTCAVMPEEDCKKYYGQDIDALAKTVDRIIPMQYKGNYEAGTSWLKSTTKYFSGKAKIWSGLQTYKSDEDPTKLSSSELLTDAKTCLSSGARGIVLFRYGICPSINFSSLQDKTTVALTSANIKTLANTVKTYIDKNKKLPSTVTINKVKYTWPQIWYILSYAVNNLGKSLTKVPNINKCTKANGKVINEKITSSDYKDQAKRILQYMKQNGKAPNFVTTVKSKTRVRPRVSIDALARAVVYYYEKKKLLTVTFNSKRFKSSSKPKYRKYGRSTEYGCDNRGQNNGHNCGPHMIQEIIRNLTGKVISQSTLASVIGTTSEGSDHDGLNTSIAWFNKKYGYNLKVEWKNFSELGWSGIKKILESNNQDCGVHELYRNTWGHYTNFDKIYSDYLDVHNSLGDSCSQGCYCGYTEQRDKSEAESYIMGISQKSVMVVTNETN